MRMCTHNNRTIIRFIVACTFFVGTGTYARCQSWELPVVSLFAQAQPPVKLPVDSPVTVAYSPQGAEALRALTGKVIKGVMLLHVTADGGAANIYTEAAKVGISAIPPDVALPLLSRTRQKNWKQIALDVGGILGGLTGTLGITNVIPISNGWSAGLSFLPVVLQLASAPLRDRLPETGWQSRLCQLRVEAGASCLMLARYQPMGPKVVEVR